MSYKTISTSRTDAALQARITAATVQEAWSGGALADTTYAATVRANEYASTSMIYPVLVSSDIAAAYASALAAGNPDPGDDEAVITDGMILGAVQGKWPVDEA